MFRHTFKLICFCGLVVLLAACDPQRVRPPGAVRYLVTPTLAVNVPLIGHTPTPFPPPRNTPAITHTPVASPTPPTTPAPTPTPVMAAAGTPLPVQETHDPAEENGEEENGEEENGEEENGEEENGEEGNGDEEAGNGDAEEAPVDAPLEGVEDEADGAEENETEENGAEQDGAQGAEGGEAEEEAETPVVQPSPAIVGTPTPAVTPGQ
jgi:hypothetical protein